MLANESTNILDSPTPIEQVFPDVNLAEEVRATLNKLSTTSLVTQAELDTMQYIYANYAGIQNIEGVQYLHNVKELILSYNQIQDITPLAQLQYLEELYLDNNPITNHDALQNITSLTWLSMYNTKLEDSSVFSNLTNLKYLDMGNNQVKDISSLDKLVNLTWFSAFSNQLSNIDVVSNFSKLTNLNLYNNKIDTIQAISNLLDLETLYLNNNQIQDITPISKLSKLKTLYLYSNQINNIQPLYNLINISTLSLSNQKITLPVLSFNEQIMVDNAIFDLEGERVTPTSISNEGIYESPSVVFNLSSFVDTLHYSFSKSVSLGSASAVFSGSVTQPLVNRYEVNFHFNNSSLDYISEYVGEGLFVHEPTIPSYVGHTFISWNTKQDGSGFDWEFNSMQMPSSNLDLYAQWKPLSYTLSFYQNDGIDRNPIDTQVVVYNTLAEAIQEPIRSGYTFKHWNTKADGSGEVWEFTQSRMPSRAIDLYAQWQLIQKPEQDKKIPNKPNIIPTGDQTRRMINTCMLLVSMGYIVTKMNKNIKNNNDNM